MRVAASDVQADRRINFRNGRAAILENVRFPSNKVKTTKYTWHSFVPLNLWEHLQKFGNFYFLCISVIMYLGEKTPLYLGTIKAFSTLGVLLMMMTVTAVMALLDDLRRG